MQPRTTTDDGRLADADRRYIDEIVAKVSAIKEDQQLSYADLAHKTGIAAGTLSPFLTGKYRGNNLQLARNLEAWLNNREEAAKIRSVVREAPAWVETPSARRFMEAMSFAQVMPDISVIATAPGLGKTKAITRFAATHSNVWCMVAEPHMQTVPKLLLAIADMLGLETRHPNIVSKAIASRLNETNGLIIVDEAQHLSTKLLDQLRTYHDQCGVGIVLVGNATVYGRLKGGDSNADFATLVSRVGFRLLQDKARDDDAAMLLDAWQIDGDETRKLLHTVAKKPGALRSLTKVLKLALMSASGAGQDLTPEHIRTAYAQLSPSSV